ncbi:hypothetical protein GCM10011357_34430 [Lacimicrobium alkaliphilum]|uniref:Uncharacterized protein n=1 Tax=Lacimicrobium alkaliphilum TaxID=1526571 RepID=A0ABQ1RQX8_9ALTE|nr:hypothetical protein GCM10011357_34430 [Lacimicrobium alkaliphilum]
MTVPVITQMVAASDKLLVTATGVIQRILTSLNYMIITGAKGDNLAELLQ